MSACTYRHRELSPMRPSVFVRPTDWYPSRRSRCRPPRERCSDLPAGNTRSQPRGSARPRTARQKERFLWKLRAVSKPAGLRKRKSHPSTVVRMPDAVVPEQRAAGSFFHCPRVHRFLLVCLSKPRTLSPWEFPVSSAAATIHSIRLFHWLSQTYRVWKKKQIKCC